MAVTRSPAEDPGLPVGALFRAALGRMRQTTRLPVVFGGALSAADRTVHLAELAGPRPGARRGLAIRAGKGWGGQVLLTGRPGRVDDYATDAWISHEYDRPVTAEGLRAIAAVPVIAGDSLVGLLYGGVREPLPLG